jgi:hypothetical protein
VLCARVDLPNETINYALRPSGRFRKASSSQLGPTNSNQINQRRFFSCLCLMEYIYTTPLLNYCQFSRHVAGDLSITQFDVSYSAIHLGNCVIIIWFL